MEDEFFGGNHLVKPSVALQIIFINTERSFAYY